MTRYLDRQIDMTDADRAALRRHFAYLSKEIGVTSLVATFPDAGRCTVYRDGNVCRDATNPINVSRFSAGSHA